MPKICFNEGWRYRKEGAGSWKSVSLPHDAMLEEPRTAESAGGANIGFFEGHNYEYAKNFTLSDISGKKFYLEFEGVYRNARVRVNGKEAGFRPYGYTDFFLDVTNFLQRGENFLTVTAKNADQPNSRWYSGSGIYRPVWLYELPEKHILPNGVKIVTADFLKGEVEVSVETSHGGSVKIEIEDGGNIVAQGEGERVSLLLPDVKLWSPETPFLYTCRVTYHEDVREIPFGVRQIACDAKKGFCINGKRVILRGACIHHDNGILGACAYPEAEERKIALLKEAGYNAIRSAHNPCSKALLDACDRLGMLVMDEYADMWYVHKTRYDYAARLPDFWREDLKEMAEKDFNHPSVILYSTGNEVGETSEKRGIALTKQFTDYLHELDPTRPVTCGVNIWFNAMYKMGFGQYSDKKAEKQASAKKGRKPAVGSEFFNNLAGKLGAGFMKTMATLPLCDRVTKDAFANMDVAGYNYGIKRYLHDMKKYPDRVIVGSETFCSDAYLFWELAKTHPALIGDFVWAGIDYLGEAGVGSWEYKEYAPAPGGSVGWIAAGSGRLDLTGSPLGEALYTKVAFELETTPQIAVVPVSHTKEKHFPSAWKFSNALPSWSWNGLDGKPARVEVYSRAPVVELFVNGKRVGKKKFKKNCRFDFKVKYRGGEIVAVAEDKGGRELARNALKTAGGETALSVLPEKKEIKSGELCFVRLRFTDREGTLKPLEHRAIAVEVEGGELVALGNACPFNRDGYLGTSTDTYYGEALAVVRAGDSGFTLKATDGHLRGEASVPCFPKK